MPSPVKIPAKVIEIQKFSDSVAAFTFEPQKRVPRFRAGQFLHLALDKYDPSHDWPESRVFSIANGSSNRKLMRTLISVKGKFTRRVFSELSVGSEVWLKMPYGDFVIDKNSPDIVLVAGGTGIAPFVSFLEDAVNQNPGNCIQLYYGVKAPELIIFEELFASCQKEIDNFNYTIFIEDKKIENYQTSRLDIEKIYAETAQFSPVYYLSGPFEMISKFKEYLERKGVSKDKIKIDEW